MTKDISPPSAPSDDSNSEQFKSLLASRASRKISRRSRASSRGAAPFNGRPIQFESGHERGFFALAKIHPDVVDILDQPPRIRYRDARGVWRWHTFDYLITLKSGRRIAVAVKPAALAKKRHFVDELKFVRASTPKAFADDVVLATEKQIHKNDVLNAMRISTFRRDVDAEADQLVATLVAEITEPTSIGELVRQSGLAGRAYRAIARAVGAGMLSVPPRVVLDYETPVTAGAAS